MKIRQLEKNERFDAFLISAYCFHRRMDDEEKERERVTNDETENWGAFTDEGALAAHILNVSYRFYVDGTPVKGGGIGCVSTLPEYRKSGAIASIFKELLQNAYKNGEVISALYPFNHAFYRKQGYEVVPFQNEYELKPAYLECYRSDCEVTMWHPGDSVAEYLKVHNEFIKHYNFSVPRDEETMLNHIKVNAVYRDRKFTYLFKKNGKSVAYLIFTDVWNADGAILRVNESAWLDRDGFEAILSFLGRFDADYAKIKLPLPYGIDLLRIIRTRSAYDIEKSCCQDFMVRVINAEELLRVMKKPACCDFTIKITDEIIPENNAVWRVCGENVQKISDGSLIPDMEISERSFAQMAVGSLSVDEAMLKPDVRVNANEEMLRNVFVEKKIYVNEHF